MRALSDDNGQSSSSAIEEYLRKAGGGYPWHIERVGELSPGDPVLSDISEDSAAVYIWVIDGMPRYVGKAATPHRALVQWKIASRLANGEDCVGQPWHSRFGTALAGGATCELFIVARLRSEALAYEAEEHLTRAIGVGRLDGGLLWNGDYGGAGVSSEWARNVVHAERDPVTGKSLHAMNGGAATHAKRDPVTGKSLTAMKVHARRDPVTGKSLTAMKTNAIIHAERDPVTGKSLHAMKAAANGHAKRDPVTGKSINAMKNGAAAHDERDPVTGKSLNAIKAGAARKRDAVTGKLIAAMNGGAATHAARDPVTGKSLHAMKVHAERDPVTGKSLHAMKVHAERDPVTGKSLTAMKAGAASAAANARRRIERERNTPCLIPFEDENALLARNPQWNQPTRVAHKPPAKSRGSSVPDLF
jgi:hypothetical protein